MLSSVILFHDERGKLQDLHISYTEVPSIFLHCFLALFLTFLKSVFVFLIFFTSCFLFLFLCLSGFLEVRFSFLLAFLPPREATRLWSEFKNEENIVRSSALLLYEKNTFFYTVVYSSLCILKLGLYRSCQSFTDQWPRTVKGDQLGQPRILNTK